MSITNNEHCDTVAVDKIKNILVSFEKKKRNLEKRKNKLDEYKKKLDLNEDQEAAVSKYGEVMSNLELLEELTSHALQQLREAEKSIKKAKKQEKIDRKRCDRELIENVLRCYGVLCLYGDRGDSRVRERAVREGRVGARESELLLGVCAGLRMEDGGEGVRKSAECVQSVLEGGGGEGCVLKAVVGRLAEAEWLWRVGEGCVSAVECCDRGEQVQVEEATEAVEEEEEELEVQKEVEKTEERIIEESVNNPSAVAAVDSQKLSFVFLHESVVKQDNANRSSVEEEGSGCGSRVEDVFSSATQSQFLQLDNGDNDNDDEGLTKNVWVKGGGRQLEMATTNSNNIGRERETQLSGGDGGNCWKTTSIRGPPNNTNARFARLPGRGRERGRGGRMNNRPFSDALHAQ